MPDTAIPTIPTVPVTPAVLDGLRAIVGDKGLILDDQGKQPFVTDWRGSMVGTAAVVVRPGNTEEVSKVVKLCFDNGIAIVPQGGNTGLMGGATPWPDAHRHRAVARPHEQGARGRSGRLLDDRRGGLRPADPAGDGGQP